MNLIIQEGTDLNTIAENEIQPYYDTSEEALKFDDDIYELLPPILRSTFNLINDPQKRDSGLLALLTIASNAIRNLEVVYLDQIQGCQLYFYVLSDPGHGKGFAAKFRDVGLKWHNYLKKAFEDKKEDLKLSTENNKTIIRESFYLSGNISKAALSKELADNNGYGVFFVTEADTIVTANKSDHGSFSEILRQGFHSEHYSANKLYWNEIIDLEKVVLSVFITSTFNQCIKLMPNFEDGLFSRFGYYILSPNSSFKNPFINKNYHSLEQEIKKLSDVIFDVASYQNELNKVSFKLNEEQQEALFNLFSNLERKVAGNMPLLKGSIYRMSLIATRISMILTYLRKWKEIKRNKFDSITCEEDDFSAAISITKKLVDHLMIVVGLYRKHSKQFKSQVSIKLKTGKNYELKRECIRLRTQGLSYSQISMKLFGNEDHKGTAKKWFDKYGNMSFPFPETETETVINTLNLLNQTKVSVYNTVRSETPSKSQTIFSILKPKYSSYDTRPAIIALKAHNEKVLAIKNVYHFTPAGITDGNAFTSYSNLIAFEIKRSQNDHIDNFNELKDELSAILNIVYCGSTLLGNYLLLIPIEEPLLESEYANSLTEAFKRLGIIAKWLPGNTKVAMPYDIDPHIPTGGVTVFKTLIKSNRTA